MKKSLILALTLFFCGNIFGQQLSFSELILIAKDQKEFEKKMFGLGNKIIEIGKSEGGYSYEFGDGGWGSSGPEYMPTSDSRYEKKWLFPDNKIYTSSQIEANGLDKDFAIRNSLQPINKDSIKGFIYLENLSLLHKTYDIHSSFGHNYNKEESTASTFYDLKITEREMIYPDASPKNIWYSSLSIFYVNREKYLNTIREVQEKCEYIETKQMYTGEYQTIYQYRNFTVKTNEGSEYGGNISIHFNIDS